MELRTLKLLTNKIITSIDVFSLGLGYEFRRVKLRIRGIYGGDIFFKQANNKLIIPVEMNIVQPI